MSRDGVGPTPFVVHDTPVLSAGNVQTLLAMAPGLWAHVKVYAEGGENGLHAHPREDHLFFVLAGEATFFGPTGEAKVVGPCEGMLLPRGTLYSFRSTGDRNLVMLRVGAPTDTALVGGTPPSDGQGIPEAVRERVMADGSPAPGLAPSNKAGAVPGVVVPGRTLGRPAWP